MLVWIPLLLLLHLHRLHDRCALLLLLSLCA